MWWFFHFLSCYQFASFLVSKLLWYDGCVYEVINRHLWRAAPTKSLCIYFITGSQKRKKRLPSTSLSLFVLSAIIDRYGNTSRKALESESSKNRFWSVFYGEGKSEISVKSSQLLWWMKTNSLIFPIWIACCKDMPEIQWVEFCPHFLTYNPTEVNGDPMCNWSQNLLLSLEHMNKLATCQSKQTIYFHFNTVVSCSLY